MSFLLALLAPAASSAQNPDSAMVGSWSGRAQMSLPFTAKTELMVQLVIAADGAVTGTVGDATLTGGRLSAGQGAMGRALRLGREYMIEGGLSGSLLRSEGVQRARVVISLDWQGGTFVGELQTSGPHDGAPENRAIVAKGLVLHRG